MGSSGVNFEEEFERYTEENNKNIGLDMLPLQLVRKLALVEDAERFSNDELEKVLRERALSLAKREYTDIEEIIGEDSTLLAGWFKLRRLLVDSQEERKALYRYVPTDACVHLLILYGYTGDTSGGRRFIWEYHPFQFVADPRYQEKFAEWLLGREIVRWWRQQVGTGGEKEKIASDVKASEVSIDEVIESGREVLKRGILEDLVEFIREVSFIVAQPSLLIDERYRNLISIVLEVVDRVLRSEYREYICSVFESLPLAELLRAAHVDEDYKQRLIEMYIRAIKIVLKRPTPNYVYRIFTAPAWGVVDKLNLENVDSYIELFTDGVCYLYNESKRALRPQTMNEFLEFLRRHRIYDVFKKLDDGFFGDRQALKEKWVFLLSLLGLRYPALYREFENVWISRLISSDISFLLKWLGDVYDPRRFGFFKKVERCYGRPFIFMLPGLVWVIQLLVEIGVEEIKDEKLKEQIDTLLHSAMRSLVHSGTPDDVSESLTGFPFSEFWVSSLVSSVDCEMLASWLLKILETDDLCVIDEIFRMFPISELLRNMDIEARRRFLLGFLGKLEELISRHAGGYDYLDRLIFVYLQYLTLSKFFEILDDKSKEDLLKYLWKKISSPDVVLERNTFLFYAKLLDLPHIWEELSENLRKWLSEEVLRLGKKLKDQSPSEQLDIYLAYIYSPELFKKMVPREYEDLIDYLNEIRGDRVSDLTALEDSVVRRVGAGKKLYVSGVRNIDKALRKLEEQFSKLEKVIADPDNIAGDKYCEVFSLITGEMLPIILLLLKHEGVQRKQLIEYLLSMFEYLLRRHSGDEDDFLFFLGSWLLIVLARHIYGAMVEDVDLARKIWIFVRSSFSKGHPCYLLFYLFALKNGLLYVPEYADYGIGPPEWRALVLEAKSDRLKFYNLKRKWTYEHLLDEISSRRVIDYSSEKRMLLLATILPQPVLRELLDVR